jgi:hypothetical protein
MPYEVITGWGRDRRVLQTLSRAEAEAEHERLRCEGKAPEIWLGLLQIRAAP